MAGEDADARLRAGAREGRRYDAIGAGYAERRREDPRLARLVLRALGGARSVVNVGAGAGSYEPRDRAVVPVEPSSLMARQRTAERPAPLRAVARRLPLRDASVDAAMTVLSLHHWHPRPREGVREMARVARDRVVIVTIDPRVSGRMWLMAEYLPEVAELDHRIFPLPETIRAWLGGGTEVATVPVHRDTPDGTLLSFWAHPERVLDPGARAATSGFARQPDAVVERVVRQVARDLESGAWDRRHGRLRELEELDAGLRLIVATLGGGPRRGSAARASTAGPPSSESAAPADEREEEARGPECRASGEPFRSREPAPLHPGLRAPDSVRTREAIPR